VVIEAAVGTKYGAAIAGMVSSMIATRINVPTFGTI
jgi:hypothetical protein